MKNKKARMVIIVSALIGCMAVGGTMAYFTDGDTATNEFTVGSISIDLQEPSWDPDTATDLVPEQEVRKDPQVKNDGVNDAYVFLEVTVPYANVVTAKDDGTKVAAADTELFCYDVKEGWTELTGEMAKDTANHTVTHLYAYTGAASSAMEALPAGSTTSTLFEWVKLVNVVEDQNLEESAKNIEIHAYAIQTSNLNDGKSALDGSNTDGMTSPADVWAVLSGQNG